MEPFIGEIRAFGFNFAPYGWMQCNGQLLSIQQNAALFTILGTTYGGDGVTTFGLPNLQGSVAVSSGQSTQFGTVYSIGNTGGAANVTLNSTQMPAHTHTFNGATVTGVGSVINQPSNTTYLSNAGSRANATASPTPGRAYAPSTATPTASLNPAAVGASGSQAAHSNMMPYLVTNYCIALVGDYPQRP
ncbi:phage tail protein [Mucilaginibacter sp. Bleaf8]|uniref:phage tail protein n=1 Tax=Mucilaginibacter sp. Bleaf8 TaxID=2834430 RepID=UPI001BCD8BB9|nr:tail fiber protein [Mucilaginibacter sp. Bleaf8]MBS7563836.1 phage tail protein [Mucilaginibacter sp. Bleaf8]